MSAKEKSLYNLKYIETLSFGDSYVHRLDPRIKLLTTVFFIITVVSFEKYTVFRMVPFFMFPVILISAGNINFKYILKRTFILSPFILLISIFNPVLDTRVILKTGWFTLTYGWISFFSIILRFILTVFTTYALIAITGFNKLCLSLEKMKVPKVFAVQLLLVYRYIYILIEEVFLIVRAHNLRSFKEKIKLKNFIYLISQLLLRSIDRSERIYLAMLSRGFDGTIHLPVKLKIHTKDIIFITLWMIYFIIMRIFPVTEIIGNIFKGLLL